MRGQTWRAALFLLVAPGLLAEVVSQNTSLAEYFSPVTFMLGSLTYGVPVLLIREIAAARGLGVAGVAILGIAYGILNEGVIARTLTQASGPPLFDFAGYGQVGPIQSGWTIFMLAWHALHSVLYPILLARWLYPAAASGLWFATGAARWVRYPIGVAMVGLYALYFLNPPGGDLGIFLLYAAVTAALVLVSLRFGNRDVASPRPNTVSWPALAGMSTAILYLGALAAPGHIPFAWYALAFAATVALAIFGVRHAGWRPLPELLRFGLGDYLGFTVLGAALAVTTRPEPLQSVIAGVVFVVAFGALLRATARQPDGRGVNARLATVAMEDT